MLINNCPYGIFDSSKKEVQDLIRSSFYLLYPIDHVADLSVFPINEGCKISPVMPMHHHSFVVISTISTLPLADFLCYVKGGAISNKQITKILKPSFMIP